MIGLFSPYHSFPLKKCTFMLARASGLHFTKITFTQKDQKTMRKLTILSTILLLTSTLLYAQKNISEGTIIYSVAWQLPDEIQEMAKDFPSEIKVYFKADSSSTKTESSMYSSNSILHPPSNFEQILIDVPLIGKKYSVTFTPEDQQKMADNMPQLELNPTAETKVLVGYQVHKYTGTERKSGQNFDAWFTKDIQVTSNALSRFYEKSYGFPIEFTAFLNGLSLKATVKEIKTGSVPKGSFSASKDYEPITIDQLIQMSGSN